MRKPAGSRACSCRQAGYYKTPEISLGPARRRTGRPFLYFAYGAACSEVAIDTLTGEMRVLRVDILHDVGASLNPAIDMGQVEGGFVQGMGWLTTEELVYDGKGRLPTHAPATYKIPVASDMPPISTRGCACGRIRPTSIYRSKAVGEPPFMHGISVYSRHPRRGARLQRQGPPGPAVAGDAGGGIAGGGVAGIGKSREGGARPLTLALSPQAGRGDLKRRLGAALDATRVDWIEGTRRLAEREARLVDLWADDGAVCLALADPDIRILRLACPEGGFPSVGAAHPGAIRLERALADLHGLTPEGAPDARPWLDHGRFDLVAPLGRAALRAVPLPPYAFRSAEGPGCIKSL